MAKSIILGETTIDNKRIEPISIAAYTNQLLHYLQNYLNKLNLINDNTISANANEKAKIAIQAIILPEDKEIQKDFKKYVEGNIGEKTKLIIKNNLKTIMLLLGEICECIIIENCKRDRTINVKCINMAMFKPDIYEEYNDIEYDVYTPFSPSHKRILLYNEKGNLFFKENKLFLEPNHINKDIVWCDKNNTARLLKFHIPTHGYEEAARLQIKASIDYRNVLLSDKYIVSPIIYFDIMGDANNLKMKYQNYSIKSASEIDLSLSLETEKYFKILAAYFTGLISSLDILIENTNILFNGFDNAMLKYIFNSDMYSLLNPEVVNNSAIIYDNLIKTIDGYNIPKELDLTMI